MAVTLPGALLVVRSRKVLKLTQKELALKVGFAQRTLVRWEGGGSQFYPSDALKLAPHVYPVDRGVAAELVAYAGQTLVSAGLEAPPPPALPAEPPPPPPPPIAPEILLALVESVVCAAADAADSTPKAVRASVHLVLRHAHALRLDLDAAMKAGLLGEG
jgi:DNA-binding XRE family transcriptional regulator